MIDPNNLIFADLGYKPNKLLATGEYAGVMRMAYTWGLFVGLDECGYRTRFCYPSEAEALAAFREWDGNGWPPGYWIKQKPEDIQGPGSKEPGLAKAETSS